MPRKKSKAVPEGNDPVPQDSSALLDRITKGELCQVIYEALDKYFNELKKSLDRMSETIDRILRVTDQRLAGLEQDARQPRLATEADVLTDSKTRKRTEDAAADRAKHGNSCSAKKVDPNPMFLTTFGDDSTKPAALPYRDDAMFDKGAAAPKPCLLPVEIRTPTAASGLLPVDIAYTAMRTIFFRPLFSWSLGKETKKSNSRTNNQLPPPCWTRVIITKSRLAL